jgi:hypothetical protein
MKYIERKIMVTPELLEKWAKECDEIADSYELRAHGAKDKKDKEMKECYSSDAEDAKVVAQLLREGNLQGAISQVFYLDTAPREDYDWYYSISETSLHLLLGDKAFKSEYVYLLEEGPSYDDLVEALKEIMPQFLKTKKKLRAKTMKTWKKVKA